MKPERNIIPRSTLFGNPDKILVKSSHDGKFISYVAPCNNVLNVFVAPVENTLMAQVVTNDTKRGVRNYQWSYDNEHIVYLQDNDGDENWHIYVANAVTKVNHDLTPFTGVKAEILGVSSKFPKEILIIMNRRRSDYFDVYKLNIESGDLELKYQNDSFVEFISDEELQLRFARKTNENGGAIIYSFEGDEFTKEFMAINYEDYATTGIIGCGLDGTTVYVLDSTQRNTSALFKMQSDGSAKELMYEHNKVDVDGVLLHPVYHTPQAILFNYLHKEWVILDDNISLCFSYLQKVLTGEISISSRSLDDTIWVVQEEKDNGPIAYYIYHTNTHTLTFLFYHKQALDSIVLQQMHPIVLKARDGLEMVSYLTVPDNVYLEGSGSNLKASVAVPMVLLVHGGPAARDKWGYNAHHQWLANRGYAVLSVNYRGSTGFGKRFLTAGFGEWAAKMHDDLVDAVFWAINCGIAIADRVAIMGGSYGGYATLVGLAITPDIFACGIDIVGPSNLVTLVETIPPYWKPIRSFLHKQICGEECIIDTEESTTILRKKSPINYVNNITKPLLIGHGANDPRVKQSESEQIVNSMRQKSIPVTYVLYPDEGHGFMRPENRMSFYAVAEAFLAQYLNGIYEPGIGYADSSIKFQHGREFLPNASC